MEQVVKNFLQFMIGLHKDVYQNPFLFWIGCFLIGIGFSIYWFGVRPFQIFNNYGIPHPKSTMFVGNLLQFFKMGTVGIHDYCIKEFGGLYGLYIGRRPIVAICDPSMIEQALVKGFSNFHNRPPFVVVQKKPMDRGLLTVEYKEWKRIRPVVSPTFSAGKLKEMLPLVQKSTDTYIEIITDACRNGDRVDVFRSFGRLTMEVIMSVGFGLENDFQKKGDVTVTKEAMKFFQLSSMAFWQEVLPLPRFLKGWIKDTFSALSPDFFVKMLKPILKSRRTGAAGDSTPRKDFLQLLLAENKVDGQAKLSEDEIHATAITFLLAGYETTSNSLGYTLYLLALNQDVQERLHQEIVENFDEKASVYEEIQKLVYLDAVYKESLRMYPPAYALSRMVENECTMGGYRIPKGVSIVIPVYSLHHSEKYWENSDKFDPDRFMPERKSSINPYAYLPFGAGPRNCVGMRFAVAEAKLAIIKLVKKFKFEGSAETEVPLELKFGLTMTPKNGIFLNITERN